MGWAQPGRLVRSSREEWAQAAGTGWENLEEKRQPAPEVDGSREAELELLKVEKMVLGVYGDGA